MQSARFETIQYYDNFVYQIDIECEKRTSETKNIQFKKDLNLIRHDMFTEIAKIRDFNLQHFGFKFKSLIFIPISSNLIVSLDYIAYPNFGTLIILNNKINCSIINEIKRFFLHVRITNNKFYCSDFHFDTFKVRFLYLLYI